MPIAEYQHIRPFVHDNSIEFEYAIPVSGLTFTITHRNFMAHDHSHTQIHTLHIIHDIGISADSLCLDEALVPQVPHVLLLYPESDPNDESPLGGLGDALGPLQQPIPGNSPPGQAPPAPAGIGP